MVTTQFILRADNERETYSFEYVTDNNGRVTHSTGTVHCWDCSCSIAAMLNEIVSGAVLTQAVEIVTHKRPGGEIVDGS